MPQFHFHDSAVEKLYTGISDTFPQDTSARQEAFAELMKKTTQALSPNKNSHISEWTEIIKKAPPLSQAYPEIQEGAVCIGEETRRKEELQTLLQGLHPWRKGPFMVHGVFIDAEWRSDMKWERIKKGMLPLQNRNILDIGSGNGYYGIRAMMEGAASVTGLEPYLTNLFQFLTLKKYLKYSNIHTLPIGIEDFPEGVFRYDTLFSMGILYHRKSPLEHLMKIRKLLNPGGELILETIVVEGGKERGLVPEGRYARMRNVWFIPSDKAVHVWLKKCGFKDVELIDRTKTTPDEQRSTEWMQYKSLSDFLDPIDDTKTIEGHPAPVRAVFTARSY